MTNESSFLSQTLQSITSTKKREQDKRRTTFEDRKSKLLQAVDAAENQTAKLEVLLSGLQELSFSNKGVWYVDSDQEKSVQNVSRYLEQSRHDSSVSMNILRRFETKVREKLEQESERFNFANLYYRLLTEWTSTDSKPIAESELKQGDLDGSFEHVQRYNLQNLKDKFSSVVFTPLETDEVEIDNYLSSLFDDEHAEKILNDLRANVARFGADLKQRANPFDPPVLKQCICALLTNDLLNDDAKATLSDFSTNDVVLAEIADVLNLRFSDLDNWSWEAEDGMYYEPRRQANGKYRIMMDQDILQAIFLHYIAVSWSAHLKQQFTSLAYDDKFWKTKNKPSRLEESRRTYFSNKLQQSNQGVAGAQLETFRNTFLLSALPSSLHHGSDPYGEDPESGGKKKSGLAIRQLLLQQIATDVIIRRALHGSVAVVQSDLQWYATGLPHSTLFAVLRFWGIPEDWIMFFKKFAEAPLRMDPTPGQNVQIRKRGIPITDAFEKLFGESVLWCMDVAVNRLCSTTLIRFHDDLWLCGEPSLCAQAWETIQDFVKVLGLDINTKKTGSVYVSDRPKESIAASKLPHGPVCMGMLQLSESGDWTLDQKQVSAHVRQLQKRLGESQSIIGWVQIWNACMGKFFKNAFGRPANCFGHAHVDAILKTFAKMQRELFEEHNGSVSEYLRQQIHQRFGVEDVPDAFFFALEELGGLGLQSPFVPFYILKDQLIKNPLDRIAEFHKAEKAKYKELQESFEMLSAQDRQRRFDSSFHSARETGFPNEPFFSFEEYTAHRETYSYELKQAYDDLMREPVEKSIELTNDVAPWFEELCHSHKIRWDDNMSSENKWIMHLYAEELKHRFGALSIVDRNLLPSGVMQMLKKKKVIWQLIIWD
ncbi:uncharacterized protein CC84DRAFT_1259019 [Paraphaeosphaeria sporulosa]|uniref:Reverse transcriptase domain-containing protein n=1 Tax=Paraphaeosphaeria sporulosa TaxID=1460663 RepID=A0A177CFJ1_9PLEO|nr:uncharacterized protein CC84DRAFT_1259019 [Paraphaeosphaeria sporulosa]OAG05609.1 hypothetical protein CC84DRAFT_1259019 [Paraphaeosphaeria sporulosa]